MFTVIILKLGLPTIAVWLALFVTNIVVLLVAVWLLGKSLKKSSYAPKRLFTPEIPRL